MPKNVYSTRITEGMERPSVAVTILGGNPSIQFRAVSWGNDTPGHWFFETTDGQRVELNGKSSFVLQIPAPGFTIDESGRHRECRKDESLVTLQ